MADREWVDIICPFYMRKEGLAIRCGKIVPGTTSTSSRFCTSKELGAWLCKYCKSFDYTKCPFAKLADENPAWINSK